MSMFLRTLPGLADAHDALVKSDEGPACLQLKKAGRLWSVRAGLHYRALAREQERDVGRCWIGHHAEYGRLPGGREVRSSPGRFNDSAPDN
jgi:hypothetical protein